MSKPYKGDWVLRTVLFVPGHINKMLIKGAVSDADCVILDLEDAVPSDKKGMARKKVREILEKDVYSRKTVFVRVNPFKTNQTIKDIEEVSCKNLNGFVYPSVNTSDELKEFDSYLQDIEKKLSRSIGNFSLIALIESPLAIVNIDQIAKASERMVGLIFGCEDYLAELCGRHSIDEVSLNVPRAQVAIAARAVGIEPIDTPYINIYDFDGLRKFAEIGRNLGMSGMCAITPRQIPIIQEIYTPTQKEINTAKEIIEAATESQSAGKGIAIVNKKFIAPPIVKSALKVLKQIKAIHNLEEFNNS